MNQSVESVDFGNRKLTCTSGKNFEYDRLIIAAGVEAVGVEKKAGHHLKGIFTLKTYDDSQVRLLKCLTSYKISSLIEFFISEYN